jgi:hypothetical protein
LQENIPVGEYLIAIGFVNQPFVLSKKLTLAEKETATANFKVDVANPNQRVINGQVLKGQELTDARALAAGFQTGFVSTAGVTSTVVLFPEEEKQAAQYMAESYMKIAPRDENAPRGSIEVTIDNWQNGSNPGLFMKVHLTKTESSTSPDNSRTEGVGFALKGHFLREKIPVGEYLVEIGFTDKPFVQSKKITVKKNENATVKFKLKVADSGVNIE